MLRWAYTDELELSGDDAFLIDLMKLANRFQLHLLRERWAPALLCFSSASSTLFSNTLLDAGVISMT